MASDGSLIENLEMIEYEEFIATSRSKSISNYYDEEKVVKR